MKNKKKKILMGVLALIACLSTRANAVKFYDTVGTRYEGAVERLGELKLIDGVAEKAFDPNRKITRAEFAKMIVNTTLTNSEQSALFGNFEQSAYTDISKNEWYYRYVVIATNYGYISGYEDNTFRPNDYVTCEQVAKMCMKALGHGYLSETDPRGWSAEYMDKLYLMNIADGATKFDKTDSVTRGNAAIMLWNVLTSNMWEKIYLNDVDGFTYVESDKTLFGKKAKGHSFRKNFKVDGFKEKDGNLYVEIDGSYYKLYDQEATALFTMIGGKAEGLFRLMRYPYDKFTFEIVGLSSDVGSELYSGTIEDLELDGFSLKVPRTKIGTYTDFVYLLKSDEEKNDRAISVDTTSKNFYIEKIEIKSENGQEQKDDEETIEKIKSSNPVYEYVEKYTPSTKKIKINENYEINDGAVLFENNKRVNWNTIKEGDIVTEVKKNEYYFVSREKTTLAVKDYEILDDGIKFITEDREIIAYSKADFLEYYAKDGKTIKLSKIKEEDLDKLKGIKLRFYLDFTGRATRIEAVEETAEEKQNMGIKELNMGFYKRFLELDKGNSIKLVFDGKEIVFPTTLKSVDAKYGDLVYFEVESGKIVTGVKPVANGTKLTDKLQVKKITYKELTDLIEKGEITDRTPLSVATYYYDFGEFERVDEFQVKKTNISILDDIDKEKIEVYIVADDNNKKLVLILDYSEKKDLFYGTVERIYTEDSKAKIIINIVGHKKLTFGISGLLNCEEGDFISFKILDKDNIKILEKYRVSSMGYYKDIIVKEVNKEKIVAENGEINLKEGKIVTKTDEYILSHYDIILLNLKKDEEDKLYISKGYPVAAKEINLQVNDRIAINEIENTIIIYRGY